MRTVCISILLLLGCGPEDHTLLSARLDAGGAAQSDAGDGTGQVQWTSCNGAFDGAGQTGDTCDFSGACSHDVPDPAGARCLRRELLVAAVTLEEMDENPCAAPVETNGGAFEVIGHPEPGCFSGRRCGAPSSPTRLFRYCQRGASANLRADAGAPFTGCADALLRGRDADPCVGDFLCADTVDGHGLIAWCHDGILRLGPDYPFYHF